MIFRGGRAHRADEHTAAAAHVEFADLLDVFAQPEDAGASAERVAEPVVTVAPATSRFAETGLDDDRLPQRPAKRRRRR